MNSTPQEKVDTLADQLDADILLYLGDIEGGYDDLIIDECRNRLKRKNILLLLSTFGGSPHAAYRIARCLQEAYHTIPNEEDESRVSKKGDFIVFVDGVCKSAGTLICLGANKIIMSGNGELGPIDTQLPKENEVRGYTSGLTPIQAMHFLDNKTAVSYGNLFASTLKSHPRISTKMGSDIAIQLTIGIMAPLYAQIDPLKLAEVDRSLSIAEEYGKRLNSGNLRNGSLNRLLGGYPSHGFVIDRKEARELFINLEEPSAAMREFGDIFKERYNDFNETKSFVKFVSTERASLEERIKIKQDKISSLETIGGVND